jgi:O-antigen ligase
MAECVSGKINPTFWQRPVVRAIPYAVSRANRVRIALTFAFLFAFLGVMGRLIFVPGLKNCRGYYLILPVGLVTLTLLGTKTTWKALLICTPIIAFIICSGATADREAITQSNTPMGMKYAAGASSPTLSALMLATQSLFVIATASHIRNAATVAKVRLVEVFLMGYLITLCAGYILMAGRMMGVLSAEFINMFNPEGILGDKRFAPGSGANEYGISSSFALTTMLLYQFCGMGRRHPRTWLMIVIGHPLLQFVWVPLAFVAICFTNTRSAILAFPGAVCWILLRTLAPQFRRLSIAGNSVPLFLFGVLGIVAMLILMPFLISNIDHLKFLFEKFSDVAEGDGSTEGRFVMWREALNRFDSYPLLGAGYPTHEFIHNTYIQLLCDLGVLGVALLIGTGAIVFALFHGRLSGADCVVPRSAEDKFLMYVREVGLLHVLWFAVTGHNFDHFLPWFVILLVLAAGRQVASQNAKSSTGRRESGVCDSRMCVT